MSPDSKLSAKRGAGASGVALEDVGRAGVNPQVVIHPGSYQSRVAADGDGLPELVGCCAVCGSELRHLAPSAGASGVALEDVGRAGVGPQVVIRPGSHQRRVAADGDGQAESAAKSLANCGKVTA